MTDKQFDHDEFKESYAHYRHLEQLRSGHLAFFFALVAGFLGFLGFWLKDGKPVVDWFLFVGGLIIVFLQILDTVIFTAIRRIGDARAQHAASIRYLRGQLTTDKVIAEGWKAFEEKAHVSVQLAAEVTLHLFAFLFFVAASVGVIYALNTSAILCWQGSVVLSLSLVFALAHVAVSFWLRPPKKRTI